MNEERLPQRMLEWCPPERLKKGRPRNSWMQQITTEIRERVSTTWNGSTEKNGEEK